MTTGRDIIAEFLEPFGDQPYRMADVLIGRLYKAKLEFGPSDDEFTRVVMENERLRAVIDALRDFLVERERIMQAYDDGKTPDAIMHLRDGANVHHERMMAALDQLDEPETT